MEYDTELVKKVKVMVGQGRGDHVIADNLGITRHMARRIMQYLKGSPIEPHLQSIEETDSTMQASAVCQARSLEALLDMLDVDLNAWYVERWVGNQWGDGSMWQIKAFFKRKAHEALGIEELLEELANSGPIKPRQYAYAPLKGGRRALEISVADPHFGLRAFTPMSRDNYDFDLAQDLWHRGIQLLLERAQPYGFDNIIFTMGNDLMHADNIWHSTTAGTGQPEMDSWHHTFLQVEELLLETIEGLSRIAPVHVPVVPGNHGRQSEFALGRIIDRYFSRDENVTVDCQGSPYVFARYGCNLIGYEHGHSIKANRLASLMANERPQDWADTWNREWHCADQHRDSALMSEFGVVIRFLPSMVASNEWAKLKSFSGQQRASLGFIYGYDEGRIGSVQVNAKELYGGGV